MIFDYDKLSLRIVEMFGTLVNFANEVRQAPGKVSDKLEGKAPMTRDDIITWGEALMIEPGAITAYFFTEKEVNAL